MQYDLSKLERMTLEEVREIAQNMGIKARRSQGLRELSYMILDAQADNRAAEVQAKMDAKAERKAAEGDKPKRERTRVTVKQTKAKKINTANMVDENRVVTVGAPQEEMKEMIERNKQNNHKPNKTVLAIDAKKPLPLLSKDELPEKTKSQEKAAEETVAEGAVAGAATAAKAAVTEGVVAEGAKAENATPTEEKPAPKKRGRKPKKAVAEEAAEATKETTPEQAQQVENQSSTKETEDKQANENKKESNEPKKKNRFTIDLGDNVIAMGTLECAADGYGFLRSADYNYLPSPDDVYVSKEQIRNYGLKPGDTVECTVRINPQPDKYFPMDKVIRINGLEPEKAKKRVAFEHLTPSSRTRNSNSARVTTIR